MPEHPTTVGINVRLGHPDVATLPTGELHRVSNDADGLAERIERLRPIDARDRIVLAATGGSERACALALANVGLPVATVNPLQTSDFTRASGRTHQGRPRRLHAHAPHHPQRHHETRPRLGATADPQISG